MKIVLQLDFTKDRLGLTGGSGGGVKGGENALPRNFSFWHHFEKYRPGAKVCHFVSGKSQVSTVGARCWLEKKRIVWLWYFGLIFFSLFLSFYFSAL